ncbi:MAG: hypothetical protein JWN70_1847 [Planctomycetaceae bacterium]|nr:hypothetical protein [Planctomycetaceae bacterium]
MNDDYPDKDLPWNFYFNGEVMPKWGACWGMARVASFLQPGRNADQDVGHRDIYITYCQIDHVGSVESADPDVFIYAVQEVLHIFLSQRESILATLGEQSPDVYSGLVEAALRMRELAVERRCAFWTSGYEADRVRLVEVMRRCQLPSDSPEFTLPPHVQRLRRRLQAAREEQVRRLHQLAQSGQFDKDLRKRLHEIRAD